MASPTTATTAAIPTIITDDQHEEIWKHLLEDVLKYKKDDDVFKVLSNNGINDVEELMSEFASNPEDIAKWKYKRQNESSYWTISKKAVSDITALQDFVSMNVSKLGLSTPAEISYTQYMSMARYDFSVMRTNPTYKRSINRTIPTSIPPTPPAAGNTVTTTPIMASPSPAPPPPPANTTNTPINTNLSNVNTNSGFNGKSPVESFQRSIKRDPTLFPTLKNDHGFDSWDRGTTIQAKVQGVGNVLDKNYVPNTPDDIALFALHQGYMYSVFEQNLLTDVGKSFVRAQEHTHDAQAVYADTKQHYTESMNAKVNSSDLNRYIVTSTISDSKWKGTTHAYVLHWFEQVRRYHSLVPQAAHFNEDTLLQMLHNAVQSNPALRMVYQQTEQNAIMTGVTLTYKQYCAILLSTCTTYDASLRAKAGNAVPSQRNIYASEQDYNTVTSGITDDFGTNDTYNIDTATSTIEANFTRVRGSSMTKDQWNRIEKVDKKYQDMWDQFPPEVKKIILEPRPPLKPTGQLPSTSRNNIKYLQQQNDKRRINLSEMSALELIDTMNEVDDSDDTHGPDAVTDDDSPNPLLAFMTKQTDKLHPAHLQRLMSSQQGSSNSKSSQPSRKITENDNVKVKSVEFQGNTYTCNVADVQLKHRCYKVSRSSRSKQRALVDRGANGGVAGTDVTVINREIERMVDITGVENHQVKDVHIGSVAGLVSSDKGPVIVFLHQQALLCKGSSIISSVQLESAGCDVNDKSLKLKGGLQRIIKDGYVFPLSIINGLPRLKIRPVTDEELEDTTIPQVHLTDDVEWDPTIFDNDVDDDPEWFDTHQETPVELNNPLFDEFGDYRNPVIINSAILTDTFLDSYQELKEHVIPAREIKLEIHNRDVAPAAREIKDTPIDYEALRPNFAWQPAEIVKKTFECTTQYGRLPMGDKFQKHYRSPHPALNVRRRDEDVATDTIYSDTPAIDDGSTVAQFYCGRESLVSDVYGIKTDSQFINTLQDNIRERGAMNRLLSDRAQVEIAGRVLDFLRTFVIGSWQSEPHQQHQNPAERRYQTVKRLSNTIMNRTGSPAYTWLLALTYVCFILNYSASASLNGNCPMNVMTGSTHDCSPILRFRWWELVEYKIDDSTFPSDSTSHIGHFVGFSENVGHKMTFKILTLDTLKVLHRSNVRSAEDEDTVNWKAIGALDDENVPEIIKSVRNKLVPSKEDEEDKEGTNTQDSTLDESIVETMPTIKIQDLIGRTFLMDTKEDGEKHRARIVEAIEDHQDDTLKNPELIKFRCAVNDEQYEEVLSYNEIMAHIEDHEDDTRVWQFRRIVSHEGPIHNKHPNWRGSNYNVMIEWENGEITREPLSMIAADDPVTCAIYAKDNDLLEQPGWKRFKRIAKRQKKMFRMANQAKLRSFRTAPKYMYGFEIPRDYSHALRLDERNGNHNWRESTKLEFDQLKEYDTFINIGFAKTPDGYKKIRVHLVYAVKHDGRHKARCVADGHLTDVPVDSVYSGVVSLRGIRMLIFLAELNGLETWGTDVGNAYLEAVTSERLVIIAGPEFGDDLVGRTMIIYKALYGLRTSGLRWHERFADVLRDEGFEPCKMENDLWLREKNNIYEYVAVYVDDLGFAMIDPKTFTSRLIDKYQFKLKGTGPIEYHLGCDFVRDKDGTLSMLPKKYIDRMVDGYTRMFGEKPNRRVRSPLEENDHPEVDESDFLDADGVAKYQSLVGSMQWAISLGRLDIATACMTLSSFRSCPRIGHLDRAKRVVSYLNNMSEARIRFRTKLPDYSDLPGFEYNWDLSIYGDVREEIPHDAPKPLGNTVQFTHFVDANLYHDMLTGRSVTGVLHMANQTPIDWYTKKQGKVETATYGSEFMAARTTIEQIIDLRLTFRYLGVPISIKSYMFGDNEAVVNSAARIDSKLHKRHNALSYHRVREAIASRMVDFHHIPGAHNPADILSKHWSYGKVWDLLQPLMFWQGDTADIPEYKSDKQNKKKSNASDTSKTMTLNTMSQE